MQMTIDGGQGNQPRLLDQVRMRIHRLGLSRRTEKVYVGWVKRYIRFHRMQHPKDLGKVHIEAFLSDLALHGKVSPATQNQALSALLFLYKQVLNQEMPWVDDVRRAKP